MFIAEHSVLGASGAHVNNGALGDVVGLEPWAERWKLLGPVMGLCVLGNSWGQGRAGAGDRTCAG